MASSFANQGAVAIELAEARAEQQRAAMLDERDRIAAHLHNHVIQRLFAAGLSLQSVAMGLGCSPVTERVVATVADLDATISQIRTTIFQLHDLPRTDPGGVRARVLAVAAEAGTALSLEPAVRFTGTLDTLATDIAEDLVAVVREALTNVARHARARTAEVDLTARLTIWSSPSATTASAWRPAPAAADWPTCADELSGTAERSTSAPASPPAPWSPGRSRTTSPSATWA